MHTLFLHGAGGRDDGRMLAAGLALRLGHHVPVPDLPDEDMSWATWRDAVRSALAEGTEPVAVVGHSFGASVVLRALAEQPRSQVRGLVLLGMPDWGPAGWDAAEYRLPADLTPPDLPIFLHHCRDDEVVPVLHLRAHRQQLPGSVVRVHATGGHLLVGHLDSVAADVAALTAHSAPRGV